MIELNVNKEELKKSLTFANSATGDSKSSIESHCLFSLSCDTLKVVSTNKSTCFSRSYVNATKCSGEGSFTADPDKLLNLIKVSGSDNIGIIYHPETTSLEVYASEESDSFVSLSSFDPTLFPLIEDNFDKAYEVKTIDAGIFIKGLAFAGGFISTGNGAGKFGNVFITDGVIYGSNGNNQAGAYSSGEFTGLTELAFPGLIISQISNIINKLNFFDITLKTTSNAIFICSGDYSYGFTKVQTQMPRMPITIEEPTTNNWNIDKKLLIKKINRLKISGESGMGLEMCFSKTKLDLVTKAERPSKETLPCVGLEEEIFTADCWMVEKIMGLFEGDSISIFSGKRRINLFSKGSINIQEKEGERVVPFSCAALIALAVPK